MLVFSLVCQTACLSVVAVRPTPVLPREVAEQQYVPCEEVPSAMVFDWLIAGALGAGFLASVASLQNANDPFIALGAIPGSIGFGLLTAGQVASAAYGSTHAARCKRLHRLYEAAQKAKQAPKAMSAPATTQPVLLPPEDRIPVPPLPYQEMVIDSLGLVVNTSPICAFCGLAT